MVLTMADLSGQFSWLLHLVDIALVAVIVYQFLLLIKGGGMALRLLLWLAVVFPVFLISRIAGLETLGWLLDNFFSASLLLLVIIFQHDIRRALASFSRPRALPAVPQNAGSELIDEVVQAVEALSLKQVGALIVIEREMSVDSFLTVGTDIDARVTSELITSIFLPYSPIHDGAVIIQGDKLTKAGCFLPITHNPEIRKEVGTRHRAAIGLTEIMDAVVVVVSEETGRVALATGGRLIEALDKSSVRKELKRLLAGRRQT